MPAVPSSHAGALRARWLIAMIAQVVLGAGVLPAVARAADDRVTLDVRLARQTERFQSRAADSLGLSLSSSTVASVDMDFRVMNLPLDKPQPPALHVYGRALSCSRVFVSSADAAGVLARTMEAPMLEVHGGVGLAVPLGIVDNTEGAELLVRYDGGVVIAADTGENFIQSSTLDVGFERTGGAFSGSAVEVFYGHDDLYGPASAAQRWGARMRLFAGLGWLHESGDRPGGGKPAAAGAPRKPAARSEGTPPLRVFIEVEMNTDGRPGPDSLTGRAGVALDAGAVLGGVGRVFGL